MESAAHGLVGGRRLKLVHVIHRLDAAAGGAVGAATSMCAALAECGHDVTLYATGPEAREQGGAYRTRVFATQFAPMAVSAGFLSALPQLQDADLVHIHMLYRFPQAAAAWFCRGHGIPYCVQPHGALEPVLFHKRERRSAKRLYENLVEKRNLGRAAGLIYTAKGEKDAVDFLDLAPPAFIVPLGLHLSQFDQQAAGFRARHGLEERELIVWMGRLVPVKALDVLITAFAALARERPRAVLALVGPDTEGHAAALRALIVSLGLASDQVIFTGMLQGREKLAALKEADLFVLPSHTENFALAALEAMAMGRPVIVSSGVKIAPEILAAGAGLVVAPQSGELQDAMRRLLDDGQARARMGAAARQLALRYDWPVIVGELEGAYAAMIAGAAA
jgi:glycosyltransferase involved in cell wall biosynthesis